MFSLIRHNKLDEIAFESSLRSGRPPSSMTTHKDMSLVLTNYTNKTWTMFLSSFTSFVLQKNKKKRNPTLGLYYLITSLHYYTTLSKNYHGFSLLLHFPIFNYPQFLWETNHVSESNNTNKNRLNLWCTMYDQFFHWHKTTTLVSILTHYKIRFHNQMLMPIVSQI